MRFAALLGLSPLLLLAGCTSTADSLAVPADVPLPGNVASTVAAGVSGLWGLYDLTIDAESLSAATILLSPRSLQANDDLYLLSIDAFLQPGSFQIRQVTVNGGDLVLTWRLTHPFPAPQDPAGTPNGSTNRADLGIAGMLAFLLDAPATGNTYFTDVIANTALVANPDAYVRPAAVIVDPGMTANTFPYQAFVDESGNGSRVGISNGGDVTGNFGSDGWTRAELGAGNDGWTGYGVLHQGQASEREVRVPLAALQAAGPVSLKVALIAKYNDPRGGLTPAEKKANRLPPASPDASRFAYRMPHGALDVAAIEALPESGGFIPNTISASTLRFRVVDWDARATDTTFPDLSDDPAFTTVAPGESGIPSLAISIPGVLGSAAVEDLWDASTLTDDDSAYGGDSTADSGRPGDALYFEKAVTKAAGSGQVSGNFTGLVRVSDPEPTNLITALDPASLLPLTSGQPANVTYQAFQVMMAPSATPGWAVQHGGTGNDLLYAVHATPTGDCYVGGAFLGAVDFGFGSVSPSGSSDAWLLKLDAEGAPVWVRTFGGTAGDQVNRIATDPVTGDVVVTGLFNNSCDFGNGTPLAAVGSTDIYIAKYTPTNAFVWARAYGTAGADSGRGIAVDAAGEVVVSGSAVGTLDLGGGPVAGAGLADGWLLKLTSGGTHVWDRRIMGSSIDFAQRVAVNSSNEVYLAGEARSIDLGAGVICSAGGADGYVLKYTSTGTLLWTHWWGSSTNDLVDDLAVDSTGAAYVCGPFGGSLSLGGPVITNAGGFDGYLVKVSNSGVYQWDYTIRTSAVTQDRIQGLAVSPTDQVTICGVFGNDVDFGGGPRTHSTSGEDAFVARLASDGTWLWDAIYTGTGNQSLIDVASDNAGDVRSGGTFQNSVDADPGVGVQTFTAVGGIDAWTTKLKAATGRF
ncbi:MAG: hypothetical protein GEEBNDBF_02593 [bacterium]|nr:hypothetical protein [bacterium]